LLVSSGLKRRLSSMTNAAGAVGVNRGARGRYRRRARPGGPGEHSTFRSARTSSRLPRRHGHDLAAQARLVAPGAARPDVRASRDLWPAAPARPPDQNERGTVWMTKKDGMRRGPAGGPGRCSQPASGARGGGGLPFRGEDRRDRRDRLTRWRCRLLDGAASATSRKENEETDERTRERYGADSARKSSPAGDSHDARP